MYTNVEFLVRYAFEEVSLEEKYRIENKIKNDPYLANLLELIHEEKAVQNSQNSCEYFNTLDNTSVEIEDFFQSDSLEIDFTLKSINKDLDIQLIIESKIKVPSIKKILAITKNEYLVYFLKH